MHDGVEGLQVKVVELLMVVNREADYSHRCLGVIHLPTLAPLVQLPMARCVLQKRAAQPLKETAVRRLDPGRIRVCKVRVCKAPQSPLYFCAVGDLREDGPGTARPLRNDTLGNLCAL